MDFEIEGVERGNERPCVFSGGFAGLASRAAGAGAWHWHWHWHYLTSAYLAHLAQEKRHEHSAPNLQAYGMDVSQVPH